MRVRVAFCDDEQSARLHYGALLDAVAERHSLEIVKRVYETGAQLLFDMADGHFMPDIVLLDIIMPTADGIEVACELRAKGYTGAIVFVTTTDRFVFDAFDVGAFNYVVKAAEDGETRFERVFLAAVDAMERRRRKYVLLNGISEHRNVAIDSIHYFESNKHVCSVHYGPGTTFEFISTLTRVENYLMPHGFARIHRSYLVNCEDVERYTLRSCMLRDGTELPVGRQHYPSFKETMELLASVRAGRG